ncbi:hypothetical protein [Priestia megaterium]
MTNTSKEEIKRLLEGSAEEVQIIIKEVVELEKLFLHQSKPHLMEDIQRIVKKAVN